MGGHGFQNVERQPLSQSELADEVQQWASGQKNDEP